MLSSSLDALLKLSKTSSPQKLFDYDCVTLYFEVYIFTPNVACFMDHTLNIYYIHLKNVFHGIKFGSI